MIEQYLTKYNIQTTPSYWGMFRSREGIPRRIVRDDQLIPWHVLEQHRWTYPVMMLRKLARRRADAELSPDDQHALDVWLANLKKDDLVVHYDPETQEGFFYVSRRDGIDTDVIRKPERPTTKHPAAS
jgi:hypothetical protein